MKIFIFLIFFCPALFAQVDYPKDYFSPPLDVPMQLSGNFGELRPNHFHAGFDLKTLQKEGLKVYAVADGYISRMKISTFGNGKAIYITHPNGYTSVYGHLQKANDPIENYIKKAQYALKSFEIELFLKPDELIVKKGQVIAFSGNTGGSEGPHLHFEFRDTKTEKIINPMFFGFDKNIKDTKKPLISAVYVYPLDTKTSVNHSKRPLLLNLSLQKNGTYLSENVVANGKIGFGITAFDYDDVSFNSNGVFKVQSFYNGKPNFGYQFDTYSFDDMRYVNALIDYSKYKKTQQRVQKLFMKNKYGLSIIQTDENNGIISVVPNLSSVYRVEVSDFFGNKSTVSIPVQYDLLSTIIEQEPVVSNYFVRADKDSNFAKDNMSVFFPAGTFYDDFDLNFDVKNDTLFLHEDTVPAHTNFTISIEDNKYSETQREKIFIGLVEGKKVTYNPTYRKDSVFNAKVKTLGKYALVMDTIMSKIAIAKPIEGKWLSDQKTIQLTINDELSGIKSYNGYLNGNWVLFEYDNKTKKITHNFSDGIVAEGANDLKVVVTDNVGNSTTFETHFFRSQKK
ncbi:M23 family metallopeptidase [Flavobacterium gawalongense]|uniref:M23 family metallopeptidase n=1 Tax=Flavobacterium gawalongense TaxID=2594432 RepID=A0A553BL29_9FLAO|nr:M23 family metallopeptidase [Flavobacterium gawalongense]TRX08952.1 M23 family metallopeptidase [Flavobacterium gawalongense]TRX10061.1 M23 family metallopeptidase [Flavobacterium gawalongense]TRX26906.1 M23 family metallopeptidase [Flavobacterium gawalongense]